MRLRVLVLTILVALVSGVHAQAPESYRVNYYNVGASQPLQTSDAFLLTAATCNQVAPTGTSTVNPRRIIWDDPANAGRVCIFTFPAGAGLFALPIPGTYEGTLVALNAGGTSAESARAPFSKLGAPSAPTGFRLVQ